MKTRPILFSAPMVRALLDGTKTQTRRVCKPADGLSYVVAVQDPSERGQRPPYFTPGWFGDEDGEIQFYCPYGQPGDQLWAREAWRTVAEANALPPRDLTPAHRIWYEANENNQPGAGKLRPSMFMPRWASRIMLELTGVRVERLQDISEADAMAEGIWKTVSGYYSYGDEYNPSYTTAWDAYRALWESINGPGSWDLNPWVWVIEFKVLKGGAP